jgi:hypothetical protein
MSAIENGTLVRHATLGVGKIVAVEPDAVHVFFPDGDKRFAAKLRLPAALPLLRSEGLERNSWLEGLSAFALDPTRRRYALSATWLTHDQAIARFLESYPQGFVDPAYVGRGTGRSERASRWRAAQEAWAGALGKVERERLVAEGELKELAKRILKVEKLVAPLHPPADADAVKEALADEEGARPFLGALVDLLAVPSPARARFEKLFAAAASLPVDPAQKWLVATLLPFLASPERHVLLRPKITREAAERLGCDLRFEPAPNWVTYGALRALAAQLLEKLKPIGARDFVDVEAFLHLTAVAKHPAKPGEGAAPVRALRRPTREAPRRVTARRAS